MFINKVVILEKILALIFECEAAKKLSFISLL